MSLDRLFAAGDAKRLKLTLYSLVFLYFILNYAITTNYLKSKTVSILFVGGNDIQFRIPLLLYLKNRGFDVSAVGSYDGDEFHNAHINYYRYSLKRWFGPVSDLKTIYELRSLLIKLKPDILHAFDTKPVIYVPISLFGKVEPKVVRTITGMGYIFSSNTLISFFLKFIYRFLHRFAAPRVSATIFQNPDDQFYFKKNKLLGKSKSYIVMSSGLDMDSFYKSIHPPNVKNLCVDFKLHGKICITMISRLVKDKGVIEFLKAAREVKKTIGNVEFLLGGPIESEGRQAVCKDLIESYSDCVNYIGCRSDVHDILSVSNIFVLPSFYREGIPRILLEAGAVSLPIITTDMPGCREVVENNVTGWLVNPRSIDCLIEAIHKALRLNPTELKLMGERSKKFISTKFTLKQVADSYKNIYRNL